MGDDLEAQMWALSWYYGEDGPDAPSRVKAMAQATDYNQIDKLDAMKERSPKQEKAFRKLIKKHSAYYENLAHLQKMKKIIKAKGY